MTEEAVRRFYSQLGVREWKRLVRNPYHQLEFDTSMHFLKKYLPESGLLLDAGGGPGRYTIELAGQGHDIVLLDVTPKLLEIARTRIKRAEVQSRVRLVEGSITDLSFRDDTFDAVTCLGGALSHVVDKIERERAIDELVRVAKDDAPIFISVIGRLGVLIGALVRYPEELGEIGELYQNMCENGDYDGSHGFAPCHFYLPEELEDSLRKRNVEILETVGLEGLAAHHRKEANRMSRKYPERWKWWMEIHAKTCTHPGAVSISEHFMIICRK